MVKMKIAACIISSALVVAMCSGCSSAIPEASSHEVSVIKIIKPNYIPEFSRVVNEFNEANGDIQIKFVDAPAATGERHRFYVSALSGSDNSIDIYWINDEWTAEFAEKGYICSISNDISVDNSRYIVDAQQRFSYNDELYALPVGVDMDCVFYRTDLIDSPPQNWNDVMMISRQPEYNAGVKMYIESEDSSDMIHNIIQIKNSSGLTYNETLNMYKELIADEVLSSAELSKTVPIDSISEFKTGSSVMLMGKVSLWNKLNSSTSAVKGNVGMAILPSDSEYLTSGYGLAVNANTENYDAVIRFMDYMNSKDVQQRLSRDCSVMPVIEELYDDEMIIDENPYLRYTKNTVKTSDSFIKYRISGERLKKMEEVLLKFFNNEETSNNTGKLLEDLLK